MSHSEHAQRNSVLRAIAAFLAAVGLMSACSLCAAAVWQRLPATPLGLVSGKASLDGPLVCHCLHCTMPHDGMHGGMCCCCANAGKESGICLRASCDTGEVALLRVAWTPPTIPLARLVLLPPVAAPVVRVFLPGRREALPLVFIAPPAQPPQISA